jgi:hypothetical protein
LFVSDSVGWVLRSTLACWLTLVTGCGAASYSYYAVRATRSFEQAKQIDALHQAPYEHAMAEAYLRKSREASSEAQYQDAIHFAQWSERMAERALEISREKRKGAAP